MNEAIESDSTSLVSTLLANAGWLVALGIVIWFFTLAKPASYQAGYDQGLAEQTAIDSAIYEQSQGLDQLPVIGTTLNLRVIRVQTGSLLAETLVLGQQNPFASKPESKTVVYSADTRIVRRVIITPEVYEQRIQEAQERGDNPSMIAPFDDVPATIADIQPGDRIEVELLNGSLANQPSFMAQSIAIVQIPTPQP